MSQDGWAYMRSDQPRVCLGCGKRVTLKQGAWFKTSDPPETWHHECKQQFDKYGQGTFAHLLADGEADDIYTFALENFMIQGASYWSPPMQFRVSHDFGEPQILFRYVPQSG